ncbi:unnamed protein product [Symbiodinium sp. KB8]|nr:unnamed protein product [Symbiodinium sp. KB8]
MASDMKGDVLREQPVQFTLLMLLGVGCCGIMAPVCCMWSRGLEASVLAFDEAGCYFVGGLFGGSILLEMLVALLMATGHFPDLGPPSWWRSSLAWCSQSR